MSDAPSPPLAENATLVLLDEGGRSSGQWLLGGETLGIGRSPDNAVFLDDREVSRHHAEVRPADGGFLLVDLGSKNGLTVNGRPLMAPARLADGDEIRIAPQYRLVFFDNAATLPAKQALPRLQLDPTTRHVSYSGRRLDPPLAVAQFAALELLASVPERVFSRDELAAVCYPDALGGISDQAIDGIIRRLRQRLEELEPGHEFIVAHRGFGYLLKPRAD